MITFCVGMLTGIALIMLLEWRKFRLLLTIGPAIKRHQEFHQEKRKFEMLENWQKQERALVKLRSSEFDEGRRGLIEQSLKVGSGSTSKDFTVKHEIVATEVNNSKVKFKVVKSSGEYADNQDYKARILELLGEWRDENDITWLETKEEFEQRVRKLADEPKLEDTSI